MSLPGFVTDAASARGTRAGTQVVHRSRLEPSGVLRPAVGGDGFIGMAACVADCKDRNPGFTNAQCRRACTAPSPPLPGGGGGGGGFNQTACVTACEVVYGVCLADSVFLGFAGCRAVRNACVASCRRNI